MKTIMITGCSSGFGLEIAKHFLAEGWHVVATMRTPRADVLPASEKLRILPLDVTNEDSIAAAVTAAGPIDVLVNNAGIGLLNALEGTPMATVREIFETNTFGTMATIRAVLPQFRERRGGVIVNVSSSVTLKSLPLLSVYTASKAAVNAFTQSLAYELAEFNIRAHTVLPGRAPDTSFGQNAMHRLQNAHEAYAPLMESVFKGWSQSTDPTTAPEDVAKVVWQVVTDPKAPGVLPAGADAVAWAAEAK